MQNNWFIRVHLRLSAAEWCFQKLPIFRFQCGVHFRQPEPLRRCAQRKRVKSPLRHGSRTRLRATPSQPASIIVDVQRRPHPNAMMILAG